MKNGNFKINIDPKDFADGCDNRDKAVRGFFSQFSTGFGAEMAVFGLVDLETNIIRLEHFLSENDENDVSNQERVDNYKKEYVQLRKELSQSLGPSFEPTYSHVKNEQNKIAREQLKENKKLYYYVLPKFYEDGSHEPWKDDDVPILI